jgi:uncharacterized HAD superfamily protein
MFDIDGVLADFQAGYHRIEHMRGLPQTEVKVWDDLWNKEVWAEIRNSETFWWNLPPRQEFLEDRSLFSDISTMRSRHEVYFVTSRPGVNVRMQTERWLNEQGIYKPTVILSTRKAEIASGIHATHSIEDKAGNAVMIAYANPKCESYILDMVYNQFPHDVIGKRVKRVQTVRQFVEDCK